MKSPGPPDPRDPERGIALVAVLAFLLLAAAFAAAFTASFAELLRETGRERLALAEVQAAAGGVAGARAALSRDPEWRGGTIPVGRGRAEVEVDPIPGRPDERRVRVVGLVPGPGPSGVSGGRRVAVTLRLGPGLPAVVSWKEWGGS